MHHNMSLGALGQADLTFVRQFRFLLEGEHLENWFHHSLNIQWDKNIIQLWSYEVLKDKIIPIHQWVEDMSSGKYPEETLIFITLDSCGNEIYRKKFHQLKIKTKESSFNYEKSNIALYYIEINYEKVTDEAILKNQLDVKHTNEIAEVHHLNGKLGII